MSTSAKAPMTLREVAKTLGVETGTLRARMSRNAPAFPAPAFKAAGAWFWHPRTVKAFVAKQENAEKAKTATS